MLPPEGTPGTDLPVRSALPALGGALDDGGTAVLVAPPGTGKTTLVPLFLAGRVAGRVLVAEPRRIAARAAARRMADLLGEPVGHRVGFSVRGETRSSAATRVEVVTTGLLVQRLQRDPELAGVDAILLDECHERQLDTDLALAFAVDARSVLRPDLLLVAASATAQSEVIAAALTPGTAPVVEATGALFDVDIVWSPPATPLPPPHGLHTDRRLLDHVASVVRRAVAETDGDVLTFLPGTGEISAVAGRLHGLPAEVVPLHGRLPPREQDRALTPDNARRVVLATAVAESSLTVPGVRTVVDAGLARVPRTDLARGLDALLTVTESRASATQRAGRAGREAPGRAYRCWSSAAHDRLPAFAEPEVATADLTGFALQLACWGAPGGTGLALLDPPPPAALQIAHETLLYLGAVDEHGRATAWGRTLLTVGAHPRLAHALLTAAGELGARAAAEVVALLSEPTPAGTGDDLVDQLRTARSTSRSWKAEVRRLERAVEASGRGGRALDSEAAGLVVGSAFPERLARRRERPGETDGGSGATASPVYLMANGTGAELAPGTALRGAEWLAIAVADRQPGRRDARIRSAVAIDEGTARHLGRALLRTERSVQWREGDVRAEEVERLGAIVLRTRRRTDPDPASVRDALLDGLRSDGLGPLRWSAAASELRGRLAACRAGFGAPWPDVSDEALLDAVSERVQLGGIRSRADLSRLDLVGLLRSMLPWSKAAELDTVAPDRVLVPSGSRIRVDYSDPEAPTLAVKVQEVFGWPAAPLVAGQPLLLHLLSPAGRPVAVTRDLASFWATGYAGVRAELRGRYPRHPWPEDPTAADATRRAKPRSR